MSRRQRFSPRAAAARGWRRVDSRAHGKLGALWLHVAGWALAHCGHPTALYPWALVAPDGSVHCTGAARGGDPQNGLAWTGLEPAMAYVERVERGELPRLPGRFDIDPAPWLSRAS